MTTEVLQGDRGERNTTVCIVGAGVAGLLMASRLGRRGIDTLLLESGGQTAAESSAEQSLNELATTSDGFVSALSGRARGLGGTSSLWGGRFLPLRPSEVGARPHVDLPAWPLDLEHLVRRYGCGVESEFGLPSSSYDSPPHGRRLLLGDHDVDVRYPKWAPYKNANLGAQLSEELAASRHVDVVLHATAAGFGLGSSGRLDTITAHSLAGGSLTVRAREFVIACGTIESTRLLLLLNRAGNDRIFTPGSGLGHYLQEHLGRRVAALELVDHKRANVTFGYRFEGGARRNPHVETSIEAQSTAGVGASFAQVTIAAPEDTATATIKRLMRSRQTKDGPTGRELARLLGSVPELGRGIGSRAVRKLHYWPGYVEARLNVWIEQLPYRGNAITLADDVDALGVPKPSITWRMLGSDEATFAHGVATTKSYWQREGLDRVASPMWLDDDPGFQSWTAGCELLYHPSGTTRMGVRADSSVVDPDLRCHDVANVSVVSASVFPTAGATGPTFTIGVLARAVADRLDGSVS